MIFFGWGRKSKRWHFRDGYLVVVWSYWHIFFCPCAYDIRWHVEGENRSEDHWISEAMIKEIIPENTPDIGKWDRYGMLYVLGGFIALIVLSSAFN